MGSLLSNERAFAVSMSCAMHRASTGNPKIRPRPSLLWGHLEPGKGDGGVSGKVKGEAYTRGTTRKWKREQREPKKIHGGGGP